MSYPGDEPDLESVCEFLGLADDPESHATYATEAHRCYRLERPTKIAATHQENFCLGANHRECPVFLGQGVAQTTTTATPPPAGPPTRDSEPAGAVPGPDGPVRQSQPQRPERPPRQAGTLGPRPRSGGISMPAATIGLLVLAIAIVGLAFLVQRILGGDDDAVTPADNLATQQALGATQTAAAAGANGDDDAPTPSNGEQPTPPANGNDDGTGEEPTPPTGNGGAPGGTTHEVVSGDTCFAIAQTYGSTVAEIIAANNLDENCSLQVGQELTIP